MDNGQNYQKFLDGDDDGMVKIIRDCKDGLILYLNGYTENIVLAEELMEDTFFKLVTKKPKFSGKSSFKTWLYTIAANEAKDYLRRSKKHRHTPIENAENSLIEQESLERSYIKEQNKLILHEALKRLNPEYRQVLWLVYFEDFSNTEAASVMKKSRRQIENLIYRAKQSLKAELTKEGFTDEDL
ncbi:MAG: RNA polymerase sigma factor [Acutalibacteraceae bacterium]